MLHQVVRRVVLLCWGGDKLISRDHGVFSLSEEEVESGVRTRNVALKTTGHRHRRFLFFLAIKIQVRIRVAGGKCARISPRLAEGISDSSA